MRLDWLVCDESLCVPEGADLTLPLTIGDGAADPAMALRKLFYAYDGATPADRRSTGFMPEGVALLDTIADDATPPPWMSEAHFDEYVQAFSVGGFEGPLNWYRAMDIRWHQRKPWRSEKTQAPYFFIGSEQDVDLEAWHGEDPLGEIHNQHADVRRIEMLPKAGHLIQLERSDDVTRLMREFLSELV